MKNTAELMITSDHSPNIDRTIERDNTIDGTKTYYTRDNRNRLIEVTDKDSGGTTIGVVDLRNRRR
jgi:hypothetical protein